MNQKQRIVQQRVLLAEAIGKLRAIDELFGAEDFHPSQTGREMGPLNGWQEGRKRFEAWAYDESPIA